MGKKVPGVVFFSKNTQKVRGRIMALVGATVAAATKVDLMT